MTRHRSHRPRLFSLESRLAPSTGQLDATFGNGGLAVTRFAGPSEERGEAIALDSLGRVLVAGHSTNGTGEDFSVARFMANGDLDTSFGNNGVVAISFGDVSQAFDVAVDSKDRVVLGGYASEGGHSVCAAVRLTSSGQLDTSFDGDGKQTVAILLDSIAYAMTVDSQDRVVLAGFASEGTGDVDMAVARLTADGALDLSFDTDGKQVVDFGSPPVNSYAYAVVTDGFDRVIMAGHTSENGTDAAVARLNPNGSLDGSFDLDGIQTVDFGSSNDVAFSVAIDSQQNIVLGGITDPTGNDREWAVARLKTFGLLDGTFDVDGVQTITFNSFNDYCYGVAVDSLDRIVCAGVTVADGGPLAVARLTIQGALDATFSGDGQAQFDNGAAYGVVVDNTDRIFTGGLYVNEPTPDIDYAVTKITLGGALDTSFSGDGKATVGLMNSSVAGANATAVDALGRVLVAGFAFGSANEDFIVARYLSNGTLDPSFGIGGMATIDFGAGGDFAIAVMVDSLGRVILAGNTFNGVDSDIGVVRLTAAGTLDTSFDGDGRQSVVFGAFNEEVSGLVIDKTNRIVVVGTTSDDFNLYQVAVARLTTTGTLDSTFDGDGSTTFAHDVFYDTGSGVALDSQGRLLIAGSSNNGVDSDFTVARLTDTGAFDLSFDTDGKKIIDLGMTEDTATGIGVDGQDRVIVAGRRYDNGDTDFAAVRLTVGGAFDPTFDTDGKQTWGFGATEEYASGVAVDSDGRLVVAGYRIDGADFDIIVSRLTSSGGLDASFDDDGRQFLDFGLINQNRVGVAIDGIGRFIISGNSIDRGLALGVARLTAGPPVVGSVTVNGGDAQRSRVTTIQVQFDQLVNLPGSPATAFQLKRQSDSATVNLAASVDTSTGKTIVNLTFSGPATEFGSLANGRYTLTVLAAQVSNGSGLLDGDFNGTGGDDFVLIGNPANAPRLFRLFGDNDGDADVDTTDFGAFRAAFGGTNPTFDFDGDGDVDTTDFGVFRAQYGSTI